MSYKYLLIIRFNSCLYYFPFIFYWDAINFLSTHKDYYSGCRYTIYHLDLEKGGFLNEDI